MRMLMRAILCISPSLKLVKPPTTKRIKGLIYLIDSDNGLSTATELRLLIHLIKMLLGGNDRGPHHILGLGGFAFGKKAISDFVSSSLAAFSQASQLNTLLMTLSIPCSALSYARVCISWPFQRA